MVTEWYIAIKKAIARGISVFNEDASQQFTLTASNSTCSFLGKEVESQEIPPKKRPTPLDLSSPMLPSRDNIHDLHGPMKEERPPEKESPQNMTLHPLPSNIGTESHSDNTMQRILAAGKEEKSIHVPASFLCDRSFPCTPGETTRSSSWATLTTRNPFFSPPNSTLPSSPFSLPPEARTCSVFPTRVSSSPGETDRRDSWDSARESPSSTPLASHELIGYVIRRSRR